MEGLKNVFRDLYKDKPLFWTLVVVAGVVLFVVIHNIAQQNSASAPTSGPSGPSNPYGSGSSGSSSGGRGKHQKHGKKNGGGGGYGGGPVLAGAYDGAEYGAGQAIPIYERLADAGAVGPQMSF